MAPPRDQRSPDRQAFSADPSPSDGDATASPSPAPSAQPVQDGAHAAASGPLDIGTGAAAILPGTWLPSGGGDPTSSGDHGIAFALAQVASASAFLVFTGDPASCGSSSSYHHADGPAAPVYVLVSVEAGGSAPPPPPPRTPTYLYLLYGEPAADGTVDAIEFDARITLVVREGSQVPGGFSVGMYNGPLRTMFQALARHIFAATESTRPDPDELPAAGSVALPTQQDATEEEEEEEEPPCACEMCAQMEPGRWYVPCCRTVLCGECRESWLPEVWCRCGLGSRPVPIPPPLDGVPRAFVLLQRPEWQIYRYVPGPRFVVVSYYNIVDAYTVPELGARFQTHLFRRDQLEGASGGGWAWAAVFAAWVPPLTGSLRIACTIHVAPRYA